MKDRRPHDEIKAGRARTPGAAPLEQEMVAEEMDGAADQLPQASRRGAAETAPTSDKLDHVIVAPASLLSPWHFPYAFGREATGQCDGKARVESCEPARNSPRAS